MAYKNTSKQIDWLSPIPTTYLTHITVFNNPLGIGLSSSYNVPSTLQRGFEVSVEFNSLSMDFKIDIDENFSIIVSNERIEYFLAELNEHECNDILFKNCSVAIKNRITGEVVDSTIQSRLIEKINAQRANICIKIQNSLQTSIKLMSELGNLDFPRHPLNKVQTDEIIAKTSKIYKALLENGLITINPIQLDFKNVSKIFNDDRVREKGKFIKTFEENIEPVIKANPDKLNCFLVTEHETDGNEQKHTFLLLVINKDMFLFDSAGHIKYGTDITKIPNIEMFSKYLKANSDMTLYYNSARIQAGHVNCYTMAHMTLCNFLDKLNELKDISQLPAYIKIFFTKSVAPQIYTEIPLDELETYEVASRKFLPPEFLVNAQMDSIVRRTLELCPEMKAYKFPDGSTVFTRRIKSQALGYIRDSAGKVINKLQIKIVDRRRKEMLAPAIRRERLEFK